MTWSETLLKRLIRKSWFVLQFKLRNALAFRNINLITFVKFRLKVTQLPSSIPTFVNNHHKFNNKTVDFRTNWSVRLEPTPSWSPLSSSSRSPGFRSTSSTSSSTFTISSRFESRIVVVVVVVVILRATFNTPGHNPFLKFFAS